MQLPSTSLTSNLSAKQCHCSAWHGLQHSTFPTAYTRPKHRTHTQLYGDATESAAAVGLGRWSYTARVMDGGSVPVWLNFRVGREGAACSPRLSWVVCLAAVGLLADCRGARGAPGRRAPTARQGCPAGATSLELEVDLFCTQLPSANSGPAKHSRDHLHREEQGSPHCCVTRTRPPC